LALPRIYYLISATIKPILRIYLGKDSRIKFINFYNELGLSP